jgi:A/G-specific adenine glycosylase
MDAMELQNALLSWFDEHKRPLPWRKRYRPYEVWVSEIMLQQTQVATVLPFFERWMKAFPTVEALAKAPEKKVLKHWQGLGYYSRARNIHASAKLIVAEHGGKFPSDFESILELKGVGRYTAGAIASIAFNEERPIVDGNVVRVLSRLFAIEGDDKEKIWGLQESLIPKGRARDFNQSLMELGALVCLPRSPKCGSCPVRKRCEAFSLGKTEEFPLPRVRKKTVRVDAGAVIIEKSGQFFLHRRPEGAIMGGLWEFPEWKVGKDEELSLEAVLERTSKEMRKTLGLAAPLEPVGTIRRSYTHHQESLRVYKVSLKNGAPKSEWPSAWARKADFKKYPFTSAHSKITKLI